MTRPTRELGKAMKDLGEKSGFDKVSDKFRGVGEAAFGLVEKVAMIGGAVVAAALGVKVLVDEFATLGHTALRAGVEVDFLAGMRFAAEKAGVPIESLDAALTTLTQNMGQAKAGTGRMLKFLMQISPVLAHQIVGAHSTSEAIGLLSDALHKLPDPARRAALAQKTLGDSALAPLLAQGSKAIQAQMAAYAGLAGSQDDAVKGALGVEESMVDMKAASDGVKAALVTGLSPALTTIIGKMTEWLVEHRGDVAQWADDIGKKLPAAVDAIVTAVRGAVGDVAKFVDDIGGWKVAAIGLAAALSVDLVASLVALGGALLTTPVGVVITGLAAIAAGIVAVTQETRNFKAFVDKYSYHGPPIGQTDEELAAEGMRNTREQAKREAYARVTGKSMDTISYEVQTRPADEMEKEFKRAQNIEYGQWYANKLPDLLRPQAAPSGSTAWGPQEVRLKVDFANAPKGMRVTADPAKGASVDLTTGYQLGAP
jgi:hypothetical protein